VATPKESMALLDYFTRSYMLKFEQRPLINRNIEKWAARDLLDSYGMDDCKRAVDWMFRVSRKHDWKTYVRICGDLITESKSAEKDKVKRAKDRAIAIAWRDGDK
jgi:hypothetical protein